MTLYMAVTADRYELPILIESRQSDLAEKLNRGIGSIMSEYSRIKHGKADCSGKRRGYLLRKVEVDDVD